MRFREFRRVVGPIYVAGGTTVGHFLFCSTVASVVLAPIVFGSRCFMFSWDEGFELCKAIGLRGGSRLYGDIWWDQPPFHALMLQGLFHFFPASLAAARAMAVVFAVGLLSTYFYMVRRSSGLGVAVGTVLLLFSAESFISLCLGVLIVVPAMAFALAGVVAYQRFRDSGRRWWLLWSGVCFGLGLQTKFTAVLLVPPLLLDWAIAYWEERRAVGSTIGEIVRGWLGISWRWWAGCGGAFLVVLAWVPAEWNAALLTPHVGQAIRADTAQTVQIFYLMVREDWGLFLAAAGGVVLALLRRRPVPWFAVWWLGVTLVAHWWQRPYWRFYYFHIAMPLGWLAVWGAKGLFEYVMAAAWVEFRRPPFRGLAAVLTLALAGTGFGFVWPGKMKKELEVFRDGKKDVEWQVVRAIEEFKPWTQWFYSNGQLFAFVAGVPLPPELAVVSMKRIISGALTEEGIVEILRRYDPEQLVVARNVGHWEPVVQYMEDRYVLNFEVGRYQHFVRRDVLARKLRRDGEVQMLPNTGGRAGQYSGQWSVTSTDRVMVPPPFRMNGLAPAR